MKSISAIILIAFLLVGCGTSSPRVLRAPSKNIVNLEQKDKEEYEAVVFDPGFEAWFNTTWSPARDRSIQYYKSWNQRYVSAWNAKATNPIASNQFFENVIQYDVTIDYGMQVERTLYYYFRYVDTKLGIPILATRPPGVL